MMGTKLPLMKFEPMQTIMTLRQHAAIAAMQGILAKGEIDWPYVCNYAVAQADALIARLEQPQPRRVTVEELRAIEEKLGHAADLLTMDPKGAIPSDAADTITTDVDEALEILGAIILRIGGDDA